MHQSDIHPSIQITLTFNTSEQPEFMVSR